MNRRQLFAAAATALIARVIPSHGISRAPLTYTFTATSQPIGKVELWRTPLVTTTRTIPTTNFSAEQGAELNRLMSDCNHN